MANEAQPNEVINIMNAVNAFLQWESLNGPPRGYEKYHPSAFGTCLRKMQYQRYEERGIVLHPTLKMPGEIPHEGRILRIFSTGHTMHERWAHLFDRMGILRGIWECANPNCGDIVDGRTESTVTHCFQQQPKKPSRKYGVDDKLGCFRPEKCVCGHTHFKYHEIPVVDEKLNLYGHADQILDFSRFDPNKFKTKKGLQILFDPNQLPKTPIVNDMKTINLNQFEPKGYNKGKPLPKLEHQIQLTIYINVLGLEYGTLIYECKDNSDTKVFQVGKNPELWSKIQEQATSMNQMVEKKLLPPPRPERQSDYECKDCRYKEICHSSKIWQDPNLDVKRQNFYAVTIGQT